MGSLRSLRREASLEESTCTTEASSTETDSLNNLFTWPVTGGFNQTYTTTSTGTTGTTSYPQYVGYGPPGPSGGPPPPHPPLKPSKPARHPHFFPAPPDNVKKEGLTRRLFKSLFSFL